MRTTFKLIAGAAALAAAASSFAINAHFLKADGTVDPKGVLVVDFKLAGLGDNVTDQITLTTQADATYQCFNNGSNAPQGVPFQIPTQVLTTTGDFTSGKNGNIVATIEAGPPDPAPAAAVSKCLDQGNKKLCMLAVSYSNSSLSDTFGAFIGVTPNPTERQFAAPSKQNPNPATCVTSL